MLAAPSFPHRRARVQATRSILAVMGHQNLATNGRSRKLANAQMCAATAAKNIFGVTLLVVAIRATTHGANAHRLPMGRRRKKGALARVSVTMGRGTKHGVTSTIRRHAALNGAIALRLDEHPAKGCSISHAFLGSQRCLHIVGEC